MSGPTRPIKLVTVAGARPNFMKIAPLLRAFAQDADFRSLLVHTGQHYDDAMSGVFFRELGIREPDYHLQVGSGSHAEQTAEILKRFDRVLEHEQPHGVVVVGDVNSTVACALAAKKRNLVLAHVEAGLRSFDRAMPEEINRIVTDAISDLLLVTEESGRANLLREGVAEQRIFTVGNLMIDTLVFNLERARQSPILDALGLRGKPFGLVTLHRPSNVDDPQRLAGLIEALAEIARELPLYFPLHPRTRARLAALPAPPGDALHLLEPLSYLDFLCLMAHSRAVFTDSGGIQEETTALGVPCLTLRDNTERPITIEQGTNTLAGATKESVLAAWSQVRANPKTGRIPPLWDGHAAARAVAAFRTYFGLAEQRAHR